MVLWIIFNGTNGSSLLFWRQRLVVCYFLDGGRERQGYVHTIDVNLELHKEHL